MDPTPDDVPVPATGEATTAPEIRPAGGAPRQWSTKTWIATGVGAVAVAAVAAFGVTQATSSGSNEQTATVAGGGGADGSSGFPGGYGVGAWGGRGGGTFGTIESIDGSTLTASSQNGGAIEVTTSDATTVTTSEDGSLTDIEAGDHVTVMSSSSDDPSAVTVTAERITDSGDTGWRIGPGAPGGRPGALSPPDGFEMPAGGQLPDGAGRGLGFDRVSGVVASIDGATFTVTTDDGSTVTVKTSDATTVSRVQKAEVSDLSVGDDVMVRGADGSDTGSGRIAAVQITEGAPFGPPDGTNGFPGGANGPRNGDPSNGGPPNGVSPNGGTT